MSALSEINEMVKEAALGMATLPAATRPTTKDLSTADGELDSWNNLAQSKMLRGVARGVKNAIPGFIDGVIGTGAGLINGTGQWLGGGSFSDGWKESNDFVKNYYSEPIRKAEMSIGGNAVKKIMDSADSLYRSNIEKAIGQTHDANGVPTKKYKDYVEGQNMLDSASDVASFGTELAITWPMWSKAIGYGAEALGAAARRVAPFVKVDPERLGSAAQKYGPFAVLTGEQMLEDSENARRLEKKRQLLMEIQRNSSMAGNNDGSIGPANPGVNSSSEKLSRMWDSANAPGPFRQSERERRLDAYNEEFRKSNAMN